MTHSFGAKTLAVFKEIMEIDDASLKRLEAHFLPGYFLPVLSVCDVNIILHQDEPLQLSRFHQETE